MFDGWYTDLMDVYRVTEIAEGNLTRNERTLIASGIKCRVYSTSNSGPSFKETAARIIKSDKLAYPLGAVSVKTGDELQVVRGGALGSGNEPVRYFAGSVQPFYDPVGGALTGLQHVEVGLLDDNVVG